MAKRSSKEQVGTLSGHWWVDSSAAGALGHGWCHCPSTPKAASRQGPLSLLREAIPTEVQGLASPLEKQDRLQEKQISQLKGRPILAAGASPALISRGVSSSSCWEGTGRPNYTLLCDRQCQKIKEIKPSGSPATPPPRMRATAWRRLWYQGGG